MFVKQKWGVKTRRVKLNNELYIFLMCWKGTAAERHWVIEKTEDLHQPIYYKGSIDWKTAIVLRCGCVYSYLCIYIEWKIGLPTKLIKIISDPKNLISWDMNAFRKQVVQVIHSHRMFQLLISQKYACKGAWKGLVQLNDHTKTE